MKTKKQSVTEFLNEKSAVYNQCVQRADGVGSRDQIKEVIFRMAKWDRKESKELCKWVNESKSQFSKEIRTLIDNL